MNSSVIAEDDNDAAAPLHTTADPRFSCNICFDDVSDPVVTQCGHLYCWGCLFRWMEPGLTAVERQVLNLQSPHDAAMMMMPGVVAVDQSHRVCPVCKSPCAVTSIIPIYVRNAEPSSSSLTANDCLPQHDNPQPSGTAAAAADEDEPEQDSPASLDSSTVTEMQNPPVEGTASSVSSPFGLRQRLRLQSTDSQTQATTTPAGTTVTTTTTTASSSTITTNTHDAVVLPARPTTRGRSLSENAVGQFQQQQQQQSSSFDNNNRTLMISQGLALGLHRALGPTTTNTPTTTSTMIPPLHRREGHGSAAHHGGVALEETDPDATEFLSRILLMLGSFVVLCLLLF